MHYYIDVAINPKENMIHADAGFGSDHSYYKRGTGRDIIARHLNVISTAMCYCPTLGTMYSQEGAC